MVSLFAAWIKSDEARKGESVIYDELQPCTEHLARAIEPFCTLYVDNQLGVSLVLGVSARMASTVVDGAPPEGLVA